jgi:hypothetical protein
MEALHGELETFYGQIKLHVDPLRLLKCKMENSFRIAQ